jgi:hypothetical protein
MPRSGTFWLVFVAYVAVVLTGLGIPLGVVNVGPTLGPILLFSGAVGGVLFKRRAPDVSAGLSWGFVVALGLVILWGVTHLTIVWP